MKRTRRIIRIFAIFTLIVMIAISALTSFTVNCWQVITGRGFEIPDESSLLAFHVTKMNSGSGEWWIYGEDTKFFYANSRATGVRYHAFPKARTGDCLGFDHLDFTTWGASITLDRNSKTEANKTRQGNLLPTP